MNRRIPHRRYPVLGYYREWVIMKILLLAGAALVIQLFLFLCTGSVVMRVRGKEDYSLSSALLMGYFAYFGIFEVICLLCEVTLIPLRTLALIMAIFAAGAIFLGLYCGYRSWIQAVNSLRYRLKLHGPVVILVLLALAATVIFVLLYSDASADSGWYVGTSATALATNTIGRFDPSTGERIVRFQARYALSCYPFHNAVISSLIRGLPVMVQARSVMSAINVLISFIAVYYLGRVLFPDRESGQGKVRSIKDRPGSVTRRRADLFVIAVFFLNVFSSTIYLPGIFLFDRSYEGKSLILNVVLVTMLAICILLWREEEEDTYPFRTMFWVTAAGVCFSASSLMALVLAFTAIVPLIAIRSKWRLLPGLFLGNVPIIAWAAVYYMMQHGMIVLRTWR